MEDEEICEEKSLEICEKVLLAIQEEDVLAVKDLFCERVRTTHDLDAELEELFTFPEGNIISYGEVNASQNTWKLHFIYDDHSNLMSVNIIEDVKTDTGKKYIIYIRHYLNSNNENYEDLIGIHDIRIVPIQEESEKSSAEDIGQAGELFETIVPQKMPDEYRQYDEGSFSSEYQKVTTENILMALQERDVSIFYGLFAKEVQNEQLYSEIENVMTFIDGEMISYSDIDGGDLGSKKTRDGYITEFSNQVTIYDIMTDAGEMYEISYYAYHVCKDSPQKQGVHSVTIRKVKTQILGDDHEVIEQIVLGE